MKVQLLVAADCPNERPAAELLHAELWEVGLVGVEVITTVIGTPQQADLRRFIGSPTILIGGRHDGSQKLSRVNRLGQFRANFGVSRPAAG